MSKYVLVVTGTSLGWDCVVGVWRENSENLERLQKLYPESDYVIHSVLFEKYVEVKEIFK